MGAKKRTKKKAAESSRWAETRSGIRLGRYPFKAGIKHYIAKKSIRFTPVTIYENGRKLEYFSEVFERFKSSGSIETTDPRHMGPAEIEAFFRWMKAKEMTNSSEGTYVKILKGYLEFWGNKIIERMAEDDEIVIKSADGDGEVRALPIEEVRRIFAAIDLIGGYPGIVMRVLLPLAFGTGCRPKEMFEAEMQDINLAAETFYVRHPKGEGSWGKKEKVNIIRQDMLRRLERSLKEREEYLAEMGVKTKFVFVNPSTGKPLCGNTFRKHKIKIEELSGVSFRIKDLRPTLLTLLVDDDLSLIGAASKQLRHERQTNTEKYYLRIDKRKAVRNALGDRWEKDAID
ncbi:MAG: site-specific integrase [Methanomassiliicoccaceae archaeon]|nr:site-specific integrase [Methanomassiliicoccaceae archaeon]